jgi:hypothetical protein
VAVGDGPDRRDHRAHRRLGGDSRYRLAADPGWRPARDPTQRRSAARVRRQLPAAALVDGGRAVRRDLCGQRRAGLGVHRSERAAGRHAAVAVAPSAHHSGGTLVPLAVAAEPADRALPRRGRAPPGRARARA